MPRRLLGWVFVFLAVPGILYTGIAAAADSPSAATIAPAYQEVDVSQAEPEKSFTFRLTNTSSYAQRYDLSAVDFGTLDETGGVAFLGDNTSDFEQKYGLASWLVLEKDIVYADPGQTQTVQVTVQNRQSLAPGGHYGAILVKASPQDTAAVGDKVKLQAVLSSLILVKKEGGLRYDLRLDSEHDNGGRLRLPSVVDLRFQNSGNVHAVPRGLVRLVDPAGHEVARGIINADSSFVLPESFRRLQVVLQPMARAWLPGHYRLAVQYRYDGGEKVTTWERDCWLVPPALILAGATLLATVSVLGWLFLRRYR